MTRAVATIYAGLCGVTMVGFACASQAGLQLQRVGVPHDGLIPAVPTALGLWLGNVAVATWPLGLARLRWQELPIVAGIGDALVVGHLAVQGLLVGGALGQQPELWRYLPHLPLEWLGIATPAAGWLIARRASGSLRTSSRLAGVSILSLAMAAVVETWAVPL